MEITKKTTSNQSNYDSVCEHSFDVTIVKICKLQNNKCLQKPLIHFWYFSPCVQNMYDISLRESNWHCKISKTEFFL